MSPLLPPEFLFRYSFTAKHVSGLPRRGKTLLNLPAECTLPNFAGLESQPAFGDVRIAWNDRGLGISVSVQGKSQRPVCDPERLGVTDGLRVWIDTRCTQSVHRAGRFCHLFELLPSGGGDAGDRPAATLWPVPRASEDSPLYDTDLLPIHADISAQAYTLEAWLPSEALHGYDPDHQPRLGFFYALQDAELGLQTLSIGPEFPFISDPSLWCTLELVKT
ncbi:MAG: hypothetical protein KF861_21405 [Planctomycetaceae bacterium]|nr:hypothetical protein [Planctomycetaceae bacterium]